jgi:hypothetical protein
MTPGYEQKSAILSVDGGNGRGFVVEGPEKRLVITGAHCLPDQPTPGSSMAEHTYEALIGPLGGETKTWAQCLFSDPVADIAVLGSPTNEQELSLQAADYDRLVSSCNTLPISDIADEALAWIMSLDGRWTGCKVQHMVGAAAGLWIGNAAHGIHRGMSGSPILATDGKAVGVVCTSTFGPESGMGGPNARLACHLPGWLVRSVLGPGLPI